MEENPPLSHEVECFQMLDFGTSKSNSEVSKSNSNILEEKYFFLENYVTSKGAVSHNIIIIIIIGFLGQIRQMSSQFHFHAFELNCFASPVVTFQIQNSAIQFRLMNC